MQRKIAVSGKSYKKVREVNPRSKVQMKNNIRPQHPTLNGSIFLKNENAKFTKNSFFC